MIGLFTALAAPEPSALIAAWTQVEAAHWVYQPGFSNAEWETLSRGEVVRRRDRIDGADRVVGAIWSTANKDALWLALQDEAHGQVVEDYVDEDLPGSVFSDRVLYQRIGLPWPFVDRQWVIHVSSNRALLGLSNGAIWERTWDLSSRRGASIESESAVWIGTNSGGWVLVDAHGGTLVVYHVRASIGGAIPDEAATLWAMSTVNALVSGVDRRARTEVQAHYIGAHEPIERPDGSMIPVFGQAVSLRTTAPPGALPTPPTESAR